MFGPLHVGFEEAVKLPVQITLSKPLYHNKVLWCMENCKDKWGWHFQSHSHFHPAYGKREYDPSTDMANPVMAFMDEDDALKFKLAKM